MLSLRPMFCELSSTKPAVPVLVQRVRGSELSPTTTDNVKIVLQPRLCTLRSYGSDRPGVMRTRKDGRDEVSAFFATLSDYIESSKKSQDIETISVRLAMIVFAVALTTEVVTGNSLFRKMGLQGIAEVAGGVKDALRSVDLYLEQNNLHMGLEAKVKSLERATF